MMWTDGWPHWPHGCEAESIRNSTPDDIKLSRPSLMKAISCQDVILLFSLASVRRHFLIMAFELTSAAQFQVLRSLIEAGW